MFLGWVLLLVRSTNLLADLARIGEVTFERIVSNRGEPGPLANVGDLDRAPVIGPASIEALRIVATT